MARAKRRKYRSTLVVLTTITFLFVFVTVFFFNAQLSSINIEVERLKKDIAKQEKVNESLTMKVNELTSFDKVREVASSMGLEYNNENIIVVNR